MGRGSAARPVRYERRARRLEIAVWHKRNIGIFRAGASGGQHCMHLTAMVGLMIENLHDAQAARARHAAFQRS